MLIFAGMADFNLIMPKMGESIMEATILRWLKKPGDMIALDETILEIATDKVDSEIPSPVAGRLEKILFEENAVVPVGQTIAVIATEAKAATAAGNGKAEPPAKEKPVAPPPPMVVKAPESPAPPPPAPIAPAVPFVPAAVVTQTPQPSPIPVDASILPLVRNIASSEGIAQAELDQITGSGHDGRVTKSDILNYLGNRSKPQSTRTSFNTSKS